MNSLLIGVVASINATRLTKTLESIDSFSFPIACYCQGFSNDEIDFFIKKYKEVTFIFVDQEEPKGNVIKIRNKLVDLAVRFQFLYMFDDDFIFHEGTMAEIYSSTLQISSLPHVGALMFNRNNGFPLSLDQLFFKKIKNSDLYFSYFDKVLNRLWMNGGILLRSGTFTKFENEDIYFHGDDIGLLIKVFLNGYDVYVKDLDVSHFAGEMENSFITIARSNIESKNNTGDIWWDIKHLNYLNFLCERRLLDIFHKKGISRVSCWGMSMHLFKNIGLSLKYFNIDTFISLSISMRQCALWAYHWWWHVPRVLENPLVTEI